MKRLTLITILLISFIGLGNSTAQEPVLKSGMSVLLKITGVPAKDQSVMYAAYSISDSGSIRLQYIGTVQASGLKPSQLAAKIEEAYKESEIYTKPTINIAVNNDTPSQSFVTVMGEVKSPGMIQLTTNMTILSAIAQSGGFTDFAGTKRVRLVRDGKEQILDLRKAGGPGDIKVLAEDTIIVKPATFMDNFRKPG